MSCPVAADLPQPESHQPSRRSAALAGLVGALLVMVLSLTAFVAGSSDQRLRGVAVGDRAVDFSLRNRQEQRISLEHFHGRPVMLVFTDAPLHLPAPIHLPEDLAVVLVTPGELSQAAAFEQRLGRRINALQDFGGEIAQRYAVSTFPTAVMIDAEGFITQRGPLVGAVAMLPQSHDQAQDRTQ